MKLFRTWWLSIGLLGSYIVTFHLWLWQPGRLSVALSGVVVAALLTVLLCRFRSYFANAWDAGVHLVVVLDILLEATLIPRHEGYSFYGCAAGFALVIALYRAWALRRRRTPA